MTSEQGATPSDEGSERTPRNGRDTPPQDQLSDPSEQDASVYWTPPPRAVTVASTLWICLGVLLAFAMIYEFFGPGSVPLSTGWLSLALWFGVGVAVIVLAKLMRQGSTGARIALTVLGAVMLLGIWTALLVVPAIVLQFRPNSNAWFQAVNGRVEA
ncbi:hypothetical protein [Nonomuraea sp. B19D2]|uniref:hypothetical protein n=1 Tax=Nonomuraea sp. B19D2 TaxID=3159561 RepID=UPI0032DBEE13